MSDSNCPVGPNTQVTLHFSLQLDDGNMVDSTFDREPATFVVGDESFLPGFEQVLNGLVAGDKKTFTLSPDQAFGEVNPDNIHRLDRQQFGNDIALEEGLVIDFAQQPSQYPVPGVVKSFDHLWVEVDFNHPLAGRGINFTVEVLAVEPVAEPQPVQINVKDISGGRR